MLSVCADAAGSGWAALVVAETPTDDALVTIAAKRAIDPDARRGDKRVMSDHVPIERPRARGPRLGVIIILIGLAFIAGSVAMGYALKTMPWFGQRTGLTAAGSTTAAAASGNPDFTPAQPLNANGEQPRVDPAWREGRGRGGGRGRGDGGGAGDQRGDDLRGGGGREHRAPKPATVRPCWG